MQKIRNYLMQYLNKPIIRIDRTSNGFLEYTDNPIILIGITPDDKIIFKYHQNSTEELNHFLPQCFTDKKWISYTEACKPNNNPKNIYWKGKMIHKKLKGEFKDMYTQPFKFCFISNSHIIVKNEYKNLIFLYSDECELIE